MSNRQRGVWASIRKVAASDRISGLIMLGFALLGLVLANLPATYHWFEELSHFHLGIPGTNIDMGLGHWAQDGLLTIFFLVVGLELRQELTTGSLSNVRAAAVPMLCAVGGMLVPPVLFVAVISLFSNFGAGDPGSLIIANGSMFSFAETAHGWAIPTATDIAFSLAVLALFAKALPGSIRAFLMTLATVDDLLAIILIAVFFSSLNAWYWFVGIAICAVAWYFLVRMKKVPWFGVAVIGILAWVMMYEAGVHPTLAGVLVGLLTPARAMYGERSPYMARAGVSNPTSTPANVGCTPASYIITQARMPMTATPNHGTFFMRTRKYQATAQIAMPTNQYQALSDEKNTAIRMIANRSSTVASVIRKARIEPGNALANSASTASENAMSVAVGIAHPCAVSAKLNIEPFAMMRLPGSPAPKFENSEMTATNSTGGTNMPPTAQSIGTAAARTFDNEPVVSS